MKIAFLHHIFQPGSGIEQVILELASRMKALGHDTSIITYNNQHQQTDVPVMEFRAPSGRLSGSVLAPAFVEINGNIRDVLDGMDVVVTSLYPMNVIPLFPRKLKAKVVFIEWGIQPYSAYSSPVDKAYLWLLNRADRYAIKWSDKVIVSNEVTRAWVEAQGVNPVKMYLYGIDFNRLGVNACHKHLCDKHNLAGAEVILYVGRQSPHKNIDVLIRATALLRDHGRNTKFLVVGSESFPEYSKQLKTLTHELRLDDSVIFTGLVSETDLADYYSLCDVFVNASSWEGYLNPEAYAFGKPIVAYNVEPHDETVQHKITGLLVDELTPEAFAQSIRALLALNHGRADMGRAGYQWAKDNLDYDIVVKRFIEAIQ